MDKTLGLIVSDISHAFGRVQVLRNVSLDVAPGEVHCLLGPSGSGKTTLLRLVSGLEKVQSGHIAILGSEVASTACHVPPERRPVGFVFQDYALFPHLNVRRNVGFGLRIGSRSERKLRIADLLASVGMMDFERAMPNTLSGGQQQRVALARALARDPAVMLLDEPFSGLDVRLRDEVRTSTIKVLKDAQVATVMVTHDPYEAMMVADRISIIQEGRIEQTGSPAELYMEPVNSQVAAALGEVNCFLGVPVEGKVATPVGEIATQRTDQVAVLVRPESLEITDAGTRLMVSMVRHLGDSIRIDCMDDEGQNVIVTSSQDCSLQEGDRVCIALRDGSSARVISA